MRILNGEVYDAIRTVALEYGGVGYDADFSNGAPLCIYGLALYAGNTHAAAMTMTKALWDAGITRHYSDTAVFRMLYAHGEQDNDEMRVSFDDWCAALNVVRAEVDDAPSEAYYMGAGIVRCSACAPMTAEIVKLEAPIACDACGHLVGLRAKGSEPSEA